MKFNAQKDLENYSYEGVGYLSLKNNGDKCTVRFMYNSLDDVEGYCVHRIKDQSGRTHSVDCIREYGDPLDMCPCCSSANFDDRKTFTKFYIPIYKVDSDEIVLWERGKSFYKQLSTLMVEKGSPFCSNTFTIERCGEAGDKDTTYEVIYEDTDNTTIEDLLEMADVEDIPSPEGTMVKKLTAEEMETLVSTRSFGTPSTDSEQQNDEREVRRRDRSDNIPRRRGTTRPDIS